MSDFILSFYLGPHCPTGERCCTEEPTSTQSSPYPSEQPTLCNLISRVWKIFTDFIENIFKWTLTYFTTLENYIFTKKTDSFVGEPESLTRSHGPSETTHVDIYLGYFFDTHVTFHANTTPGFKEDLKTRWNSVTDLNFRETDHSKYNKN